jgi:hypothetical protein
MTQQELNCLRSIASVPENDADLFVTCRTCGLAIDCRKLGDVLAHEEQCRRVPGTTEGGQGR